jgi:hypothetical protein
MPALHNREFQQIFYFLMRFRHCFWRQLPNRVRPCCSFLKWEVGDLWRCCRYDFDKTRLLCLCNVTAVAALALHSAAKQIVSRTRGVDNSRRFVLEGNGHACLLRCFAAYQLPRLGVLWMKTQSCGMDIPYYVCRDGEEPRDQARVWCRCSNPSSVRRSA